MTYNGSKEPSQLFALTFKTVGASNLSYGGGSDSCGVVPDALDTYKDVFKGGLLAGNVCWSVKAEDAPTLALYVEPSLSLSSSKVWFALQPR